MEAEIIVQLIRRVLKKNINIHMEDKIIDLGFSSMQMVQLAVSLEEHCDCEITPDVMAKISTVSDLVELIS